MCVFGPTRLITTFVKMTNPLLREATERFYLFVAGFCLLMTLFSFFKSAVNRWERANLYCALMFFCALINVLLGAGLGVKFWQLSLFFNQMVPIAMQLLYREFLDVRQQRPRLYQLMTGAIVVLLASNLLMFFQLVNGSPWGRFLEKTFESMLLFVLFFMPFSFLPYRRHPIYRFAAWSSWVTAIAFTSYLLLYRLQWPNPFPTWFAPSNLMFLALMLDGCLFLVALTLRDRQVLTEKIRFEQQAMANELSALRAQMNPHFIFNALNSIKSFTLDNKPEQANYYLTKFSKLIRQVLEQSRSEKISLKSELETLTLYLDMEKLRVNDKFTYHIAVDEAVEADFVELPPLLIQPYVENAIWHGLMPKDGPGQVAIRVEQTHDGLSITIEDNGIGRQRARELKAKTGVGHKSLGMNITAQRLDRLHQHDPWRAIVQIDDLTDAHSQPNGTRVVIHLKDE